MAQLNKTLRYTRVSLGADGDTGRRNVCHISFAKNDLRAPQASSATALMGATAANTSLATTYTPVPNPDVPRNITLTLAGTTGNIGAGNAVVTGTNVNGAVITENIVVTAATGGLLSGNKAFKTVTSVLFPATTGAGVTVSIGYGPKLGIGLPNLTTGVVRVWNKTIAGPELNSNEALVAPSASALDATVVENNTVTVAGTMNGIQNFWVYVLNYNWAVHPLIGSNTSSYGLK